MSDNTTVTPGTGATIAADNIGGVLYQRVKPVWGTDGNQVDTSASNPMPVVQTGALPAGTAAIGKLAANSGVDIGDVDVTSIAAGENHLGELGGNMITSSASFTRPSDTTAYAAGDAVNNSTSAPTIMTFANAGRVTAGSGYIVGARIVKSGSGVTAASFRLHVMHTSIAMINDNTAISGLYGSSIANATKRVGVIDFSLTSDSSDGAEAQDFSLRIPYKCDGGDTNLYGILQAKGAYTPANAEIFTIELTFDRN